MIFGFKQPLLSILICSIESRSEQLQKLLDRLKKLVLEQQAPDDVEIIVMMDDEQLSVGTKRNHLLDEAQGQYMAFIDDDDDVSDDYFVKILGSIKNNPDVDVVSFRSLRTHNGKSAQQIDYSLGTDSSRHKDGPDAYYRHLSHLVALKSSIGKTARFPVKSYGEDEQWIISLIPSIKTEVHLNDTLYYYYFDDKTSATYKKRGKIHERKVDKIVYEKINLFTNKTETKTKRGYGTIFFAGKTYRIT